MARIVTLFLLISSSLTLHGQAGYQWIDDNVLEDPGYISHFSESSDGFYWLGNISGLVRFDGKQAKSIKIQDPTSEINHGTEVSSVMFPDQEGLLWFTTNTAIHTYSPSTGNIRTYRVMTDQDTISSNYYGVLFNQVTGNFWLRAGNGIYSFSPSTGRSRLLHSPMIGVSFSHSIGSDGIIRVWGSRYINSGLEKLTVSADEQQANGTFLASSLEFTHTTPLTNHKLLAATSRGLQLINISDNQLSAQVVSKDLPTSRCHSTIPSAKRGYYWASFGSAGVFEVELATGNISRSILNGSEKGLRRPEYLSIDSQQNLWITDVTKGLLVVPKETTNFRSITLPSDDLIHDLYQDGKGDIWAITEHGKLLQLIPSSQKAVDRTELLGSTSVFRGRFYRNGLTWFLKGVESMHMRSFNDTSWRGTRAQKSIFPGLVFSRNQSLRIAGFNLRQFSFTLDSIAELPIPSIVDSVQDFSGLYPISDSTFLVPTQDNQLLQYYAQEDGSLFLQRSDTLLSTIYSYYKTKDDNIYLGTDNGLYRYDNSGLVRIVNELGPYHSNVISTIGEDLKGRLWLGASRGILYYDPVKDELRRYSKEEGLPSNQFTTANSITLSDGTMYMATTEGLVSFQPEEIIANEPLIKPYLAEIWVNRLPLSPDSSLSDLHLLKLPYARNSIDISLGLVGLQQSGLAGFSYQLVGLEDTPSFAKAGQSIKYPKLPPGEYRFEYTSLNRHGKLFKPEHFPIIIIPKFTQTRAFIVLLVAGGAALSSLIYILLLRRERAKQTRIREDKEKILAERERIATELHDDLGGDLASMVFIIDGHQYLQQQGVESELDINRIGSLANGAIKNMREMIWVLDDDQTTLTTLAEQLLSKAREMASVADLHLQADIDNNLPKYSLSSIQKKNILLIGKEAMQNIRKHANASAFTLRFIVQEKANAQYLLVEIIDNGRGMITTPGMKTKLNHGHGLKNLKARATAINGQLDISPSLPSGTRVSLSMPL